MKMTHILLIFLCGLLVGIGGMLALDSLKEPEANGGAKPDSSTASTKPGKRSRLDRARLADRPRVVRSRPVTAAADRSKATKNKPTVTQAAPARFQLPEELLVQLEKQHKNSMKKEISAKLSALKARLGLTQEQEARVKVLPMKRSPGKPKPGSATPLIWIPSSARIPWS